MPNFKEIAKHTAVILTIIFAVTLSLSLTGILPAFFNLTYLFFFVVAINVWFLALKIKSMPEKERENSKLTYFCSHLFILLLIVIAVNQFAKIEQVTALLPELTALAIGSGFLTFYSNRERVEQELENEKAQEEKAEEKRKQEFSAKFPTIAKIPILRSIVKWMYKAGWVYVLLLFLIIVFNIFLVVSQWSFIHSLSIDEWISLKTAEVYSSGNFPYMASGNPVSSGYVYFFLLSLINTFTDNFFHAGRGLNLFFYIGFIIIFYPLVKKYLNKNTAIITLLILSTSLFILNFENTIRGYIFSLFLVYFCIYLLVFVKDLFI